MAFEIKRRFSFVSAALPQDTFYLVRFVGKEAVSSLYEFDITLASEDPEIDLKEVLRQPAVLTFIREDLEFPIHGILSRFEQLHELEHVIFYRAILVPRLWHTSLYLHNQVFLDRSVPEIIEDILKQAGFTSQDYEFRLTGDYKKKEFVCQYRETHLDFVSRLMEHCGIYYYFEQTDEGEKIIITDSLNAHEDLPGDNTLYYSPPSGLVPTEEELIWTFRCTQKMLPKKVILKDYNYRKPSLDMKAEAQVDPDGRGEVFLYGEHFKDPDEGKALAKIRAEEIIAREKIFHGEGTYQGLRPGYVFKLADHFRDSFNQRYLLIEVEHTGTQAGAEVVSGVDSELFEPEEELVYRNRFQAIPADVQYRPERKTPKPRFYGTMNAKVDAAGDGKYAEIDKWGRYKMKLPFDLSGKKEGKASRWMRMSEPYAGAGYGMHFPLHKGTEVVYTCVDGDPDRPIICGAVPNPETKSPVTSENQTQNVIKTAADNAIIMEDAEGEESITISNAGGKNIIILTCGDSPMVYTESTEGEIWIKAKDDYHVFGEADGEVNISEDYSTEVGEDTSLKTGEDYKVEVGDDMSLKVGDDISVKVGSDGGWKYGGKLNTNVKSDIQTTSKKGKIGIEAKSKGIGLKAKKKITTSSKKKTSLAAKKDMVFNTKKSYKVTAKKHLKAKSSKNMAFVAGKKFQVSAKKKAIITTKDKLILGAKKEIILQCGQAKISLKNDGTITISGMKINIQAKMDLKMSGLNVKSSAKVKHETKGTMTDLNASGIVTIKGALVKIN